MRSIAFADFLIGLGILFVLEGLMFAASPAWMRRAMKSALATPDNILRIVGIGSAVVNGESGLLLPLGSPADTFAQAMAATINDAGRFEELSQRCRRWYLERANWPNWAKLILRLTQESGVGALDAVSATPAEAGARPKM